MTDIFSDVSKLRGGLEPEDASKTILQNNSNSFKIDTRHHVSK